MVHVEIEEPEFPARDLVLEISPTAHALVSGIPPFRHLIGRLGEPESAAVEQRETPFLVENGTVFAALRTIVATDAYVVIILQAVEHVGELLVLDLLRAENVEVAEPYHVAQAIDALRPAVARLVVGIRKQAHVIGRHIERLRTRTDRCGNECRE